MEVKLTQGGDSLYTSPPSPSLEEQGTSLHCNFHDLKATIIVVVVQCIPLKFFRSLRIKDSLVFHLSEFLIRVFSSMRKINFFMMSSLGSVHLIFLLPYHYTLLISQLSLFPIPHGFQNDAGMECENPAFSSHDPNLAL